jgi:hypothetical protein
MLLPSTKTTTAIHCGLSGSGQPFPLLTTNSDRWLLVVVVVDCVAAEMVVVDGGESGHYLRWRCWD